MSFFKKVSSFLLLTFSLLLFSVFISNISKATTVLFSDTFETGTLSLWSEIQGNPVVETFEISQWLKIEAQVADDEEVQAGDFTWENYDFNFDIHPVTGTDRNVFFRVQNARSGAISNLDLPVGYMFHFKTDRIVLKKFTTNTGTPLEIRTDLNVPNNVTTHIRIRVQENNIQLFLNNSSEPSINFNDDDSPYLTGRIAFASFPGTGSTIAFYDNVSVTTIDTATPTPTPTSTPTVVPTDTPTPSPTPSPTPTPTPTITPTPTPSYISLSVPDLKQYEGGWEGEIYDHMTATIHQLGCALTSASMILQYHGTNVNPDTLNDWLKIQTDGYLRNGLVNWLAVSRFSHPRLEYLRLPPTDENILTELENNRAGIVKVPGHFVVTKGQTETSFEINDPGYSDRLTLANYPDKLALNTFTPSETDLSYMMFVGDSGLIFELIDENGNIISTQNFIEDPIDYLDNLASQSGQLLSVLLYPKPKSAGYKLRVKSSTTGPYQLDTYLYNIDGNVVQNTFNGYIFGDEMDIYPIIFNTQTGINAYKSYDEFLNKLDLAYKNGQIKNWRIYYFLKRQVRVSQRYYHFKRTWIAKSILWQVKRQIRWFAPSLIPDLNALLSSL